MVLSQSLVSHFGSTKILNVRAYLLSLTCTSCSLGSIPEEDGGKLYNTCPVFGPDGTLLMTHRKVQPFSKITLKHVIPILPERLSFLPILSG